MNEYKGSKVPESSSKTLPSLVRESLYLDSKVHSTLKSLVFFKRLKKNEEDLGPKVLDSSLCNIYRKLRKHELFKEKKKFSLFKNMTE